MQEKIAWVEPKIGQFESLLKYFFTIKIQYRSDNVFGKVLQKPLSISNVINIYFTFISIK